MLPRRFGFAALAAAAAAVFIPSAAARNPDPNPDTRFATFVNADGAIGFSIGTPKDAPDEFFFTIRVHRSHAWGAVGLGAEDMPGALYLMVYDNRDQTNTTFSPRLGYGYYEPYYHDDIDFELLAGTGIYDDHMVVKGRCVRNCMSWPAKGTQGGKIDWHSANEKGIYALGPLEGFASDNPDESLKFHVQYGSFYMNMTGAHGATEPNHLTDASRSANAVLAQKYVRKADVMSTLHAVAMILSIVLLMPLGVVMMRLGRLVRWHAINQFLALLLVLMGFGVGIATSYRYQRSRSFNSYHQIIGFFIVFFLVGQFVLGVLHHRQHRRTQTPTKYGKIHVWLGRIAILLGIMNGFFGFTFALNRRYGIILAGLVIAMCVAILCTILGRRWLDIRRRRQGYRVRSGQASPYRPPVYAHDQQGPWPGHDRYSNGHIDQMNTHLPPSHTTPQQNIGLRQVVGGARGPHPHPHPHRPPQQRHGSSQQAPQAPRELI